jgi:hypothetical protein
MAVAVEVLPVFSLVLVAMAVKRVMSIQHRVMIELQ